MNIFCNYSFIKPHKIIKLHLPSFCRQEIIPDFIMFPLYESSCTTNEKIPFSYLLWDLIFCFEPISNRLQLSRDNVSKFM